MKNVVSSASFGSERCEVNISKIFHFVIKFFLVVSLNLLRFSYPKANSNKIFVYYRG